MIPGLKNIAIATGLALLLVPCALWAQLEEEKNVISNSGNFSILSNGIDISSTVGEVVIARLTSATDPNFELNQGFHNTTSPPLPDLEVSIISEEAQCPDIADGKLEILPTGCNGPYTIFFKGNGDSTMVENVSIDGYTFNNLDSGSYQVTVYGSNFCAYRDTFRVELKNNTCDVEFYTGITPNGDGRNDEWIIDNIEINQPNIVTIFSRWGQKVWSASNYNNSTIVWDGYGQSGNVLPDGTYFFTIEISGNQSASKSGWIQLTR
ncbi:MAG: gliding motility-associated C-terminal domain-containing protein [Vicingaceae bacterium]